MVREPPAHLKSFVLTLVRDAAAQMDELNAMGVVGQAALNCLRQDDHSYDGQHRKSNVYIMAQPVMVSTGKLKFMVA